MRGETSLNSDRETREKFASRLKAKKEGALRVATELYDFVALLDENPRLERALTEPSRSAQDKGHLVDALLEGQADPLTVDILKDLAGRDWSKVCHIANAVEDLSVDAAAYYTDSQGSTLRVSSELAEIHSALIDLPLVLFRLSDEYSSPKARVDLLLALIPFDRLHPVTKQLAVNATADLRGRRFLSTLMWLIDRFSEHMNQVMVTVTTAVPLSDEQGDQLVRLYGRQLGKPVHINSVVDPSVMGGMKIQYGSLVKDTTVVAQLQKLKRYMSMVG